MGDVVVAQATTAGIERLRGPISEAIEKVLAPRALVWKNDSSVRLLEGLGSYVEGAEALAGESVLVQEGGLQFAVDVDEGQKRSEEHTSELQSLMRISYAVFCLKK